jgi:hypothetical protein
MDKINEAAEYEDNYNDLTHDQTEMLMNKEKLFR